MTLHMQHNAAGIGELNRIAQQIRDHLLQAHGIAIQRHRHIRFDETVQSQLLTYHQRQVVGRYVVHHLAR